MAEKGHSDLLEENKRISDLTMSRGTSRSICLVTVKGWNGMARFLTCFLGNEY